MLLYLLYVECTILDLNVFVTSIQITRGNSVRLSKWQVNGDGICQFLSTMTSTPLTTRFHSEAVVQRCSVRKDVFRNFSKFQGKHLCQSLFFNSYRPLLKKRFWHRCFPVNFAKFLRALFFIEHLLTTASEHQKTFGFLTFSESIKMGYWREIGWC